MKIYNESIDYPLCPNCGQDGYEVPEIQYLSDTEGKIYKRKEVCPYCKCTYNIEYEVKVEFTAIIKNSKKFKKDVKDNDKTD